MSGCSTTKKQLKTSEISSASVGDLARSSYLKGCVDALVSKHKMKSKGLFFEQCMLKAKLHESEIREILSDK